MAEANMCNLNIIRVMIDALNRFYRWYGKGKKHDKSSETPPADQGRLVGGYGKPGKRKGKRSLCTFNQRKVYGSARRLRLYTGYQGSPRPDG